MPLGGISDRQHDSRAATGQFFAEDSTKVTGNDIHTIGDRMTDFDPDPNSSKPFKGLIERNRIFVTITAGVGKDRGGVLGLRG